MAEPYQTSSLFINILKGRHLNAIPLPVRKSKSLAYDIHFDRITEEIKRLSGTDNRDVIMPTVNQSWQTSNSLCTLSPLENLPLTGTKINIRQKNNNGGMWRPSEAAPENTEQSYLAECPPPNATSPRTRFNQKPWCELLKLPLPNIHYPSLGVSEWSPASLPNNPETNLGEQKELYMSEPAVTPVSENVIKFYHECGAHHALIPCGIRPETDTWYYVSGHEPVKARQKGVPPVMSKYHLYQTELTFTDDPPTQFRSSVLSGCNQDLVKDELKSQWSGKRSDRADLIYSTIGTGSSSLSYRDHQFDEYNQDDKSTKRVEPVSMMNVNSNEESNCQFSCSLDSDKKRFETITNEKSLISAESIDRDSELAKPQTELDNKENVGEPFHNDGSAKGQEKTKLSADKRIQWKLLEVDSDCTEGCRFYEANLRAEDTETEKKKVLAEPIVKKSPRTCPKLINFGTHRIQPEERKTTVQRLTKLPYRCTHFLQNSPNAHTSSNNNQMKHKNISYTSSKRRNETLLSTINLKLDFSLKQNTNITSYQASNFRQLSKGQSLAAKCDHTNQVNIPSIPGQLHDYSDNISTWAGPDNKTQIIYVGKSVLADSPRHFETTSANMLIHGSSLQSLQAKKDAFGNTNSDNRGYDENVIRAVGIPNDGLEMKETNENMRSYKVNKMGEEVTVEECFLSDNNVEDIKATCLSNLPENVVLEENRTDSIISLNGKTIDTNSLTPSAIFSAMSDALEKRKPHSPHLVRFREVQPGRNEETVPELHLRSRCATACSMASLDDVPYNSPVGSCRGSYCPVDNFNYIKGDARSHNHQTISCGFKTNNTDRVQVGNRYGHNRQVSVVPEGQQIKSDSRSRETHRDVEHIVHNNAYEHARNGLTNRSFRVILEDTEQQEKEDDTVVSESSSDKSAQTSDSAMSVTVDNLPYQSVVSTLKLYGDSDEENGDDLLGFDSHTSTDKLGKNVSTEKVSLSHRGHSGDSEFTQHLMTASDSQLHDGTFTDTCQSYLCLKKNKEIDTKETNQAGQVYKNVRFSDEDKVISFRIFESAVHEEVPPIAFYKNIPKLNTTCISDAIKHHKRMPRKPVLHTQKLQLRNVSPKNGRNKDFISRTIRCRLAGNSQMSSNYLRNMKWSSYSYNTRKQHEGAMCVKGMSLSSQACTNKTTASEEGVACNDCSHPSDNPVMYTICHKCEEELHMQYGYSVRQNGLPMLKAEISEAEKEEANDDLRCGHKSTGYCDLCTKVMSWALRKKREEIQV